MHGVAYCRNNILKYNVIVNAHHAVDDLLQKQQSTINAHHVVDETSEEAPAAEVGVVGLQVRSLRARHLLEGSSSRNSSRHASVS